MSSDYLNRPLRTEEQARQDMGLIERAAKKLAEQKPRVSIYDHDAPCMTDQGEKNIGDVDDTRRLMSVVRDTLLQTVEEVQALQKRSSLPDRFAEIVDYLDEALAVSAKELDDMERDVDHAMSREG